MGSGILVLPGLAAKIAGPASILAWILLSLASYPFAYTFASLSARRPESGGVYGFSKESFGFEAATMTSWLFGLWFITGAPAVTLIAASYLGYAFPLNRPETFLAAAAIIFTTFVVNIRGIVISSKVQLALIVSIIALIVVAILSSIPFVRLANFSPFLPFGWIPVGTAAALIFWSYLGYENVSNVAEEFENPKRDFHRSILSSILIVGALYISVSFVTIGTFAYRSGGSVAPFAALLSNVIGVFGAAGNGDPRGVYHIRHGERVHDRNVAGGLCGRKRRSFPRFLDHLNRKTAAPDRALAGIVWFLHGRACHLLFSQCGS